MRNLCLTFFMPVMFGKTSLHIFNMSNEINLQLCAHTTFPHSKIGVMMMVTSTFDSVLLVHGTKGGTFSVS